MDEVFGMRAADAIVHVSELNGNMSMYQLAKSLTGDGVTITTTQIRNYLKNGTRMSKKVAQRFEEVYGITITDVYKSEAIRRNYNKSM